MKRVVWGTVLAIILFVVLFGGFGLLTSQENRRMTYLDDAGNVVTEPCEIQYNDVVWDWQEDQSAEANQLRERAYADYLTCIEEKTSN